MITHQKINPIQAHIFKPAELLHFQTGGRILKGDTVFSLVLAILPFVPFESQLIHNYTVNTEWRGVKMSFFMPQRLALRFSKVARGL